MIARRLVFLFGLVALPAMAADIEMDSASEPDTDVDMPEVEVREPNLDRQVGPEGGGRQPNVRIPQVDLVPPRTGLNDPGDDAEDTAGGERPGVRGGMIRRDAETGRQPESGARTPAPSQRTPATGTPPANPEIRRPSTTIRAPASE